MSKKRVLLPHVLFALVVAGGVALGVGFLVRELPFFLRMILSVSSGLGGFIVGANILPSTRSRKNRDSNLVRLSAQAQRNQDELQKSAMELIRTQRTALENIAFRITNDELRSGVDRILRSYQGMAESVGQDPKDARPVKRFLNYYGEAGITLLQHDLKLGNLPDDQKNEAVGESTQRILESITELAQAFESQLAKLLDNDLLELDTELTIFNKTMALEGMVLPKKDGD